MDFKQMVLTALTMAYLMEEQLDMKVTKETEELLELEYKKLFGHLDDNGVGEFKDFLKVNLETLEERIREYRCTRNI